MEYMESCMDAFYEAGNQMAEEMFDHMSRFEEWYLNIPDADETLFCETIDYFHYANNDVEELWIHYKKERNIEW